jgi:hypothetical protein
LRKKVVVLNKKQRCYIFIYALYGSKPELVPVMTKFLSWLNDNKNVTLPTLMEEL